MNLCLRKLRKIDQLSANSGQTFGKKRNSFYLTTPGRIRIKVWQLEGKLGHPEEDISKSYPGKKKLPKMPGTNQMKYSLPSLNHPFWLLQILFIGPNVLYSLFQILIPRTLLLNDLFLLVIYLHFIPHTTFLCHLFKEMILN